MTFKQDIYKLPNLVSATRILIAPLMFTFAFLQMETWFLLALIFSGWHRCAGWDAGAQAQHDYSARRAPRQLG